MNIHIRPPISLERWALDGDGEVQSLTTPGEHLELAKSGNYTYAALEEGSMHILDVRGCRRPYKNPDQPSSVIE